MRTATDLLEELNAADESVRIEAKRARELGKSVMQTVIAFANEPGLDGGYLLLGADWFINDKGDTVYRAAGLHAPDRVQRDLASQCASMLNVVLRRLRDRGLLEKQGAGNRTYYILTRQADGDGNRSPTGTQGDMPASTEGFQEFPRAFNSELATFGFELATFPPELATFGPELATLKGHVRAKTLRDGICRLCTWAPLTGDQLATLLEKDRHYLRNKYLIPMVREGLLRFRYPESAKHPHQAYVTAKSVGFDVDAGD